MCVPLAYVHLQLTLDKNDPALIFPYGNRLCHPKLVSSLQVLYFVLNKKYLITLARSLWSYCKENKDHHGIHDLNYVFMANKLGVKINFVRGNFYLVNSTQENFGIFIT